jgi:hypothetical protein
MRQGLGSILVAMLLAAACGGRSSPTSPTDANTAPSGSSATITGTVQGATSSFLAASSGAALSGVTVSVVGTSITAGADAAGRFTLSNVPPGPVQLQLTGGGANATVSLSPVSPRQTIDVVLAVSGSTATVESEVRSGTAEAELEGRVESLPPTQPALTFKAAGRTVRTDASTRFMDGSQTRTFADLRLGMRIHAKGSLSGDTFNATLVELQNSNTSLPVIVNGVIDSLSGTASAFQFKIGSRLVKGDAQTVFFGDGNTPDTFSSLEEGSRVEVKGEQRDDYVYAARIHINDGDDDDDEQDSSASIHGTLNAMSGSKPTLVLTVGTTIVRTSSSTEVKRRGDVQTLDALKVGQTLHVIGERQTDGSINARRIEINDDETGGEFEIEGSVGGLKGTCPTVQFSVNGFSIATTGTTTFEPSGSCTLLKSGDRVTVKGTRLADGSVAATRVTRK